MTLSRTDQRLAWVVGAAAALLVLVVGLVVAGQRPAQWTAESTLVVLPSTTLSPADQSSYYETLSRGQIVATFAEVAGNRQFQQSTERALGLTEAQREDSDVSISVVPSTAVVLVRATSTSARLAEQLADGAGAGASTYFSGLVQPFTTQQVDAAAGTAYRSGGSNLTLFGVVALLSVGAGLLVRQAIRSWAPGARSGTGPTPAPRHESPSRGRTGAPAREGTPTTVNGTERTESGREVRR